MGTEQEPLGIACGLLGLVLLNNLPQFFDLVQMSLELSGQLHRLDLQPSGSLGQQAPVGFQLFQAQLTGIGLDPANTGGNAALGLDFKGAHLGGIVQMGTTAELHGVAAHVDHPYHIAVLFAEQGGGPQLLGFLNGHLPGHNGVALQDGVLNNGIDLVQFLPGHGCVMGKVKTQIIRLHQRTGLVDVVAQNAAQCLLQQMGGGVGTHNGFPAVHIDGGADNVLHMDGTAVQLAIVQVLTALVLLNIGHLKAALAQHDHAGIRHLAAHFRIEGSLIQHQNAAFTAGNGTGDLIAHADGQDLALAVEHIVAHKLGGGVVQAQVNAGPGQIAQRLPGLPGADLLLLHELFEARLVQGHVLVGHHLQGQVNGEAIGIVQLEGIGTGELGLALGLVLGKHIGKNLHTAVDGPGKVLFLHLDHLGDISSPLPQIGIVALVLVDNGLHHLMQEGMVHTQQLAVTGSPPQQTAQHIAPALVAGQNAVSDHKGRCPDMVRDDPERHVHLDTLAVGSAGDLGDLVGDVHDGIHIEEAVYILAHNGQSLQAHAGVDILMGKLCIIAVAVIIELGEYVVPDFHIPVAVAAHGAAGLAAAILLAAVVVDLAAGAAGTGAVLPEVIFLAETENPLCGNTHFLIPDFESLIVIHVDGGIQPVLIQAHDLGQELPAPVDGFPLEVVAEGEVAQHLKVSAVAGSLADVLDIAGTDALLAGADSVTGGLHLTGEVGLHRRHTGVDQQQRSIVLRDQGKAGQTQMALALEEGEEHFPKFVYAVRLSAHGFLTSIFSAKQKPRP